jgi:hypothetical protein
LIAAVAQTLKSLGGPAPKESGRQPKPTSAA